MARPGKDGVPVTGLVVDTFSVTVFSATLGVEVTVVTSLASVVELLSRDILCPAISEFSEG